MRLSEALAATRRARWDAQATGGDAIARAERCMRFLGDRPASRVRPADLARMVAAMTATGLGPASCNRHLSSLSAVLAAAGATVAIPWQREPKGRTRWLTADEVSQLAQACLPHRHGPAIAALVRFLAETGVRAGEGLRLTWSDLELEGPRAHAQVRTSKNGDARVVFLTQDAIQAARTRLPFGDKGPWYVLSQSSLNHVFRAARDAVASTRGDPQVVPHSLRHACASRLVRAGVSLPLVSAWMGHRDHRSTLRYVHIDEQGLQNAARMLQDSK